MTGKNERNLIADALVVTFTSGMSLTAWRDNGSLTREWAIYERLSRRYGRLALVTYGGVEDETIGASLPGKPTVVANTSRLEMEAYASSVPARLVEVLGSATTAVVKTNQMAGGRVAMAVAAALRARGIRTGLIARGGFLWSRFVALESTTADPSVSHARAEERALCLSADIVVGTSPAMIGDLAWALGLDPARTRLIPNYVLPEIPVRMPEERERGTVLYAGQLVRRKRVDVLIDALAYLRQHGECEARLCVIGEGPEEAALRARAVEKGVEAEFLPRVEHDELLQRMSRCAVYAQASSYEGHPKTVIEAMATGAAVVVADAPGQGRVVQHGVTGLVMPQAPEAFARAIEGLLDDMAWREALGTAASAHARMTYGVDHLLPREIEAHEAALVIAGAGLPAEACEVRWESALLDAPVDEAAARWVRSLQGFARRLEPRKRAAFLMAIDTPMYLMQGAAAVEAEGGLHPKHRLMRYHDFFVERVRSGERILDLGCGNGAVVASIASRVGAFVEGIDWNDHALETARKAVQGEAASRVRLRKGDITKDRVEGTFDVIVLSNVLEHLEDRSALLRQWRAWYGADRFLIRVPAFDREWRVPYKRELRVEWRLDETHETEYTREQLEAELADAGLRIEQCEVRWGEYWVQARAA